MKPNVVHVGLTLEEASETKKTILKSEIEMLKVASSLRKYKLLRIKELRLKMRIKKILDEAKKNVIKIESLLPSEHLPKILQEEPEEVIQERVSKAEKAIIKKEEKERRHDKDIEKQIRDIQDRLRAIQ